MRPLWRLGVDLVEFRNWNLERFREELSPAMRGEMSEQELVILDNIRQRGRRDAEERSERNRKRNKYGGMDRNKSKLSGASYQEQVIRNKYAGIRNK